MRSKLLITAITCSVVLTLTAAADDYSTLLTASPSHPVDATWLITNPSFETGDETGWTLVGKDPQGNDEFKTRDYPMTLKDGNYLMNAYQWWASLLGVSQKAINVPSGDYVLSAVVATWNGRTVTFQGNDATVTVDGQGNQTGIPVSVDVTVDQRGQLIISASSTGQWWITGHEGETQTFFKLDDVQLSCKQLFLNGIAQPLPNDNETILKADQWYYYEVAYTSDYWLVGDLDEIVYSTDALRPLSEVSTHAVASAMLLAKGRVFFKTSSNNATLHVQPRYAIEKGDEFRVVALNVDGLPNKILTIDLNADGPGEEGTKKISQYLASKGYDVIGCSEDFNYNGALMESLSGDYSCGAIRTTLSASGLSLSMIFNGFRFDTDGLNLIWKNGTVTASNESWTQWDSMVKTDGNQYVKKGYRHYDMTLGAGGPVIDVYVLHMDAGDTDATSSREAQWQQLAAAINAADASRPKLIIGDTNSRWTREDIRTNFIDRLGSHLIASDVWVEFCRDGIYPTTDMADLTDQSDPTNYSSYEIVDKIIYLNPTAASTVQLIPQSFAIEQDYTYDTVDHDGNTKALGDHKPVVVAFKYVMAGEEIPLTFHPADVDRNGRVDYRDVAALTNYIIGKTATPAADVNGDERVSISDVIAILRVLLTTTSESVY